MVKVDTQSSLASILLPQVVSALGERHFGISLVGFLNELCGAEHCSVFQLTMEHPVEVYAVSLDGTDTAHKQTQHYLREQYWRLDPSICEAQRRIGTSGCDLMRQPVSKIADSRFRDQVYARAGICDRVLLTGCVDGLTISLSVLKSSTQGLFLDDEVAHLAEYAPLLLTLLGKHARMTQPVDLSHILNDRKFIEATIAGAAENFPKREAEVCAGILYGMSTVGIALELGIGEETVMTYRKRIYERLSIGSQRELLLWYMRIVGQTTYNSYSHDRLN